MPYLCDISNSNKAKAVGIDLGTTNSLVAISQAGKAYVITDDNNNDKLASVVLYSNSEIVVGQQTSLAKNVLGTQAIHSAKRHMGSGSTFESAQGTKTAEDVSSEILKVLKKRADDHLSQNTTKAVITVPASFNDKQRNATVCAAQKAGLEVLRLINEPTAAAYAYGIKTKPKAKYLIFDLGGGTLDISIVQKRNDIFKVIKTIGDAHLGGDDIDYSIQNFLSQLGVSQLHAKRIKESLTIEESIQLNSIDKTLPQIDITKHQIEQAAQPIVQKAIDLLKQAIINHSDIEEVILVGGSTKMPYIKREVERATGMKPLDTINPDQIVAIGAAIQAEALTQGTNKVLLDVSPLTLGLETLGGVVEEIIPANSPIPIEVTKTYTNAHEKHTSIVINVMQGLGKEAAECRKYRQFTLSGIPQLPAHTARIKVTFKIDVDGILTVSAVETSSQERNPYLSMWIMQYSSTLTL